MRPAEVTGYSLAESANVEIGNTIENVGSKRVVCSKRVTRVVDYRALRRAWMGREKGRGITRTF